MRPIEPGTRFGAFVVVRAISAPRRKMVLVRCDKGHEALRLPGNLRRAGGGTRCVDCRSSDEGIRMRLLSWCERGDGCWKWTGAFQDGGYGTVQVRGIQMPAHRAAYMVFVGPIPDGMHLDHVCRNRSCINPKHLRPVTPRDNLLRSSLTRASQNLLKTHCVRGHELVGVNLRVRADGSRQCNECYRTKAYPSLRAP